MAPGHVVGLLELGPCRQQHVRRHLQHQHPALGVDAYEDGDDEVLVPAADPDPQEVAAALPAFLHGAGPVRGEGPVREVRLVRRGQSGGRQEHALVDDQFPQPVQYGLLGLR